MDFPKTDPSKLPLAGGTMGIGSIVNFAAGLVSAPSITLGDSKTGLYRLGTDQLGVALAGLPKISISSTTLTFQGDAGATATFALMGENGATQNFTRYANSTAGPAYFVRKGRGTIAVPSGLVQNDQYGTFAARGTYDGTSFVTGAQIGFTCIDPTPSATAMGSRFLVSVAAVGAVTLTETLRADVATGLSMFGANPVISSNRGHVFRALTVATLPTGVNAYTEFYITDASTAYPVGAGTAPTGSGSNKRKVYTLDGTNWLMA